MAAIGKTRIDRSEMGPLEMHVRIRSPFGPWQWRVKLARELIKLAARLLGASVWFDDSDNDAGKEGAVECATDTN